VKRIRLLIDGELRTSWAPANAKPSVDWTFAGRYLSVGKHLIAIEATDTDGNTTTATVSVTRP